MGIHDLPDSTLQLIAQHITSFPQRYALPLRPLRSHMPDTVSVTQISAARRHCASQEPVHPHATIGTRSCAVTCMCMTRDPAHTQMLRKPSSAVSLRVKMQGI